MSTEDRRAPGAARLPFDALVEVGGALGPSFEAQAINVSEEGMLLRTAYLPEAGQPLTCRFDAGPNQSVLASGEVIWARGADKGGEFGVRFTDMDAESIDSLKRICGLPAAGGPPARSGAKVRLHIDGLASPMRAKVRDSQTNEVVVGSDLSFLQVGRQLDLEDAQSGNKRPANIDRVEVAIDPTSHVPQLVVTLRYADVQGPAPEGPARNSSSRMTSASAMPFAHAQGDDLAAIEEASTRMKGALATNFAKVGPAVERFAERAKTMVELLAKRRRDAAHDVPRRTTAPPPGGGLHTSGRRVVRGEVGAAADEGPALASGLAGASAKRKAVIAGAVMVAAILGAIALNKSHHEPETEGAAVAPADVASAVASAQPPSAAPSASPADTTAFLAPPPSSLGPVSADDSDKPAHKKHIHVAPFGNGPVHHGNVLHLKMDAPIEAIEGAAQPTGFTVKIPGRKSLEAAAPLASRDSRIAAIKISNEGAGAELTVTFRDGVPNYQVSAKGDTLAISLAPIGNVESMAKKDEKGGKKHKHHKSEEL